MTSGNKYHRTAHDITPGSQAAITIDVYAVLLAFDVRDPGLQHAAKKILCAGIRGKASRAQDLREARDALDRAIQEAERAEMIERKAPRKVDHSIVVTYKRGSDTYEVRTPGVVAEGEIILDTSFTFLVAADAVCVAGIPVSHIDAGADGVHLFTVASEGA